MKISGKQLALLGLAIAALLYAGDYLALRYRMLKQQNPFGAVTVYRYYAIQKKANKVEYVFDGTENQTCVHSLFPHVGDRPCWYVQRHTEKKIEI